jgi:hypothetical protein
MRWDQWCVLRRGSIHVRDRRQRIAALQCLRERDGRVRLRLLSRADVPECWDRLVRSCVRRESAIVRRRVSLSDSHCRGRRNGGLLRVDYPIWRSISDGPEPHR